MSRVAFVMLLSILGRNVLRQKKMKINACVPIRRDHDNRNAKFKTAQRLLNKDMMTKESKLSSSKAKQTV